MSAELLVFDPGGTTGWAYRDGAGKISWGQIGPEKHHLALWGFLENIDPDVVVYEQFNYQRRDVDKGISLVIVSKEYIGVIELWCQIRHKLCIIQQPANMKFESDAKMAIWGYDLVYKNRHAKDALRHLIFYETFSEGNSAWVTALKGNL